MKIFKKRITDVYVHGMWSTQWHRSQYAVCVTYTKTLFGIKFMETTNIHAIFDTKPEARKCAKHLSRKHNVPQKFNHKD